MKKMLEKMPSRRSEFLDKPCRNGEKAVPLKGSSDRRLNRLQPNRKWFNVLSPDPPHTSSLYFSNCFIMRWKTSDSVYAVLFFIIDVMSSTELA